MEQQELLKMANKLLLNSKQIDMLNEQEVENIIMNHKFEYWDDPKEILTISERLIGLYRFKKNSRMMQFNPDEIRMMDYEAAYHIIQLKKQIKQLEAYIARGGNNNNS